MHAAAHALGNIVQSGWNILDRFGHFSLFALNTLRIAVADPSSWMRWRQISPQLYTVGAQSVIVVAITGAFIGMILALEGYDQFAALGQEQQMGGVINSAVTKQIGPVLAAVMLAGRVGGSLAAELGSMRVTEQLDAMRAMSADPVRTLVDQLLQGIHLPAGRRRRGAGRHEQLREQLHGDHHAESGARAVRQRADALAVPQPAQRLRLNAAASRRRTQTLHLRALRE